MSLRRILLSFLLPYTLILMISALMGVVLYQISINALEDQFVMDHSRTLKSGIRRLDGHLLEYNELANQWIADPQVQSLSKVNNPFAGSYLFRINAIKRQLATSNTPLSFRNAIVFEKNHLLIDTQSSYTTSSYYGNFLAYTTLTEDEWYKSLFQQRSWGRISPAQTVSYSLPNFQDRNFVPLSETKKVLPLHYTLSYSTGAAVTMFFMLDMDQVGALFDSLRVESGALILYDASDSPLAWWGDDAVADALLSEREKANDYIVTEGTGSSGWRYRLYTPHAAIIDQMAQYNSFALMMAIGYLLLGIAVLAFLIRHNHRPIANMVDILGDAYTQAHTHSRNTTAFQSLSTAIDLVLDDNQKMHRHLVRLKPLFTQSLMQALLFNDQVDIETVTMLARQAEIPLEGHSIGIAVIREVPSLGMGSYYGQEINACLLTLSAQSPAVWRGQMLMMPYNQMVVLLFLYADGSGAQAAYRQDLNAVHSALTQIRDIRYVVAGTEETVALEQVRSALKEATVIADSGVWNGHMGVLTARSQPKDVHRVTLEDSLYTRLSNIVLMGDADGMAALLKKRIDEVQSNGYNDRDALLLEFCFLWVNYEKCVDMMGTENPMTIAIDDILRDDLSPNDILPKFQRLYEGFIELCRIGREQSLLNQNHIAQQMQAFIQDNYQNSLFNLSMLADAFHMSPSQCSQFFKQHTHQGFAEYLESLRLQKAMDQLVHSQRSIEGIAGAVGYNSLSSFSRAFRRMTGISASEYRRSHTPRR